MAIFLLGHGHISISNTADNLTFIEYPLLACSNCTHLLLIHLFCVFSSYILPIKLIMQQSHTNVARDCPGAFSFTLERENTCTYNRVCIALCLNNSGLDFIQPVQRSRF